MGDGGKIAQKHIHLQNMQFLFICLAQYEELHLPAYQIVAVCWVSTETQLLCPADTWVPGCLQSSGRPGLSRQISHHRRVCSFHRFNSCFRLFPHFSAILRVAQVYDNFRRLLVNIINSFDRLQTWSPLYLPRLGRPQHRRAALCVLDTAPGDLGGSATSEEHF